MSAETIILASSSPQRSALLKQLQLPFEVVVSHFDEDSFQQTDPKQRAEQLAAAKARTVAAEYPQRWIIGCDTLVVAHTGDILEKPVDAADARRMIMMQQGTISTVLSGLCVMTPGGIEITDISVSQVHFAELSDDTVDWWIAAGLWQGRSGGFQIDGQGQLLVEKLEGDWTSVVGLPIYLLGTMLRAAGYPLLTQLTTGDTA